MLLVGSVFASDKQKVILITGTAYGIGKSTAQYLIDKGHIVYGGDILIQENLYLNDIGGISLEMDVTKQDHVDNAINQIIAEQGRIDVLVNNAGIAVVRYQYLVSQINIFTTVCIFCTCYSCF